MTERRVAVDLRALVGEPSGIGFFTLSLLGELARRGSAAGNRYLGMSQAPVYGEDTLRSAGVALEVHSAPLGLLWQQLVLPRRLRKDDVDVVWSPLLTLPTHLPVPGVVTVHDLTPLLFPETHSLKVRLTFAPFIRTSVEQAHTVVADSESTASDLRDQFSQIRDKIEVVYPGVDAAFEPASAEEIAAIRSDLGCHDGYVLFVGTLEPRKNVPLLLDAWEALSNAKQTPPLVLAGSSGWRNRTLVNRIKNLESRGVRHLSYLERPELVRLIQAARVVVLPSLYEGFGLPAAEAMASGVPTVVSNAASLPEVVGKAGLVFEPDDPEDLAGALSRVLDDVELARELGARGVERARLFSWTTAAERMEAVFERAHLENLQ